MALAFFFTQGMKNLFGKPRPDMLARCKPDTSPESIRASMVGGNWLGDLDPRFVLVSASICRYTSRSDFKDGFRSFPSGHSSSTSSDRFKKTYNTNQYIASWSGLLYLAFFLCSKFAISIPFLPPRPYSPDDTLSSVYGAPLKEDDELPIRSTDPSSSSTPSVPLRNQAAAPPIYLLLLPMIPLCAAIYITASRFFQFYHHGFDVIVGSLIGMLSSWFAFRWYHLPVSRGAGWSWGARSRDRAWAIGVGRGTYVGPEGWSSKTRQERSTHDNNSV
jgi:membrane-associated phospholipid phosphatase